MQTSNVTEMMQRMRRTVKTSKRIVIPDNALEQKLLVFVKKLKNGNDIEYSLLSLSIDLHSLDTIQPLITSGTIEAIFEKIDKFNDHQMHHILSILSNVSTTAYKNAIVVKNLENLMKTLKMMFKDPNKGNVLGILKEYLNIDECVTEKILKLGGMDMILEACKLHDPNILCTCSSMILSIVLYGGRSSINVLMKHELNLWVFPLIHIYEDRRINYYVYFSLAYLKAFHKIHHGFFELGLMDNIMCWLLENEPILRTRVSFKCKDSDILHKILLSMISSKNRIAQTFGAFQIYCELSSNLDYMTYFNEMKMIKILRRIVTYSNELTSNFARNALHMLIDVTENRLKRFPKKTISEWNADDVQEWLRNFGFQDYALFFLNIDGEGLVKITENELKNKYFVIDSVKRRLFMEERSILSGESSTKALRNHMEVTAFHYNNSTAMIEYRYSYSANCESTLVIEKPFAIIRKKYDAFISYRRQGGSELASLIFIYLREKRLRPFLDVRSLDAGKFADKLKRSIQQSKNFILLLTTDAINRCKDEGDWLTIEIEMAMKSDCNIIPITKDFDNSSFDDEILPENIKRVKEYNQILWHHDAQDSCLSKIIEYMEKKDPICPFFSLRKS